MYLASAVLDLIGRIAAEKTVMGVWHAYLGAARQAGLSTGFACFMPADRRFNLTIFADSMPDGWTRNYAEQGYGSEDPLCTRALTDTRPFHWTAQDWDQTLTPLQRRWRDDNIAANLQSGFLIPDRSSGDLKVISLAGDPAEIDPPDLMLLHFAGIEALHRMEELGIRPPPILQIHLSQRESECLKWIAAGKTDWEIGSILTLSEKTVNVYVERAKRKLGVQTRAQAVALALRNKLIEL